MLLFQPFFPITSMVMRNVNVGLEEETCYRGTWFDSVPATSYIKPTKLSLSLSSTFLSFHLHNQFFILSPSLFSLPLSLSFIIRRKQICVIHRLALERSMRKKKRRWRGSVSNKERRIKALHSSQEKKETCSQSVSFFFLLFPLLNTWSGFNQENQMVE